VAVSTVEYDKTAGRCINEVTEVTNYEDKLARGFH